MAENVKNVDSISQIRPINQKALMAKIKQYNEINSDMATVRGRMGALMKQAEEDIGIHRGAFSAIARLERMSNEKFADFDRTFGPAYADMKARKTTPDMFAGKEAEAKKSNITTLSRGASTTPKTDSHEEPPFVQ